jgi:two-component system, NtrC family, sensor histidine kinase HydH
MPRTSDRDVRNLARRTIIVVVIVGLALAGLAAMSFRMVARARTELVERFAADHLRQVEEAARAVAEEVEDSADDLKLAAQLIRTARSVADVERDLGALVAAVKPHRMAAVYAADGRRLARALDPRAGENPDAFEQAVRATAMRALSEPKAETTVNGETNGPYRVFAVALPASPSGAAVLAVLMETQVYLSRFRPLASESGSRLLVLGTDGKPAPGSDAQLVRTITNRSDSELTSAVEAMRMGRRGSMQRVDEVFSYAPVPLPGGGHWSVGKLSPTLSLRAHDRAILVRVGLVTAAIIAGLLALAVYVISSWRREAAMREQLRHAEEIAHLHDKTEKILDHVPTGVVVLSEQQRVTNLNRAMRQRVPAQAFGGGIPDLFPDASPEGLRAVRDLIEDARVFQRVRRIQAERLTLFGKEGQYTLYAIPLEPRVADAHTLLVIEDLSELDQLNSQLTRAEKLATVGVLAAGIAHEVGTPLSVARGRVEVLLEKATKGEPMTESLAIVVDQIDSVSRSIRQLLDFSRVKPPRVRPVKAAEVVDGVFELLRLEAERRQIVFERSLPEETPPLAADRDQLQQVLVNLVMNACDACEEGGHVRITSERDAERGHARLIVEDDGCGIPDANRHQVFDPFFTTKKRGQGTGLGLSIAAQIVRNHGGDIVLDSEVGRGTRVTLMWPSAEQAAGGEHDFIG